MSPTQSRAAVNAAGLFPTLTPAPTTPGLVNKEHTRPVADTSALQGAPIAGAQAAGLAALALAFVLAVTRLSVRRRHTVKPGQEAAGKPGQATAGKPADRQDSEGSEDNAGSQGAEGAPETPPSDGE